MNGRSKFLLFAVLGLSLLIAPQVSHAYFYQQGITNTGTYTAVVKTNKASYVLGEPIKISGEVNPYENGRDLQITVMNSAKKILFLQIVPVNNDATFSLSISDTAKWTKDTYRVLAQYGTSDVETGIATFSFDPTKKIDFDKDVKEKSKEVKKTKDVKKIKKPSTKPKTLKK